MRPTFLSAPVRRFGQVCAKHGTQLGLVQRTAVPTRRAPPCERAGMGELLPLQRLTLALRVRAQLESSASSILAPYPGSSKRSMHDATGNCCSAKQRDLVRHTPELRGARYPLQTGVEGAAQHAARPTVADLQNFSPCKVQVNCASL
jgi:hypothetical protein